MHRLYVFSSIALLIVGCNGAEQSADVPQPPPKQVDPGAVAPDASPPGQLPQSASAEMAPTRGNTANGALVVAADANGIRITGAIQGLPPNSELAFHVHEKGDCSAPDASSAGAHFNPTNENHGHPNSDPHHAGDMINLKASSEGVAQVDVSVRDLTLHQGRATDALGKALVIHAKPDDYKSQPAGNSGDRIACGVITVSPDAASA
jgi:Cu-Zn family superoxide dismutase